jgi:hypothetical protein
MEAPIPKTEAEQLADLATLLAAIARKAAARSERDPAAAELVDLATRAEELVHELRRIHTC